MMNFLDQVQSRRSVRSFQKKVVSSEILDKIIVVGTRAPSAGNLQSYSIIVTQDQARRKILYDIHFKQEMFLQAPAVITICADISRNSQWMKLRGADPGFDNFWGFLVGMADGWSFAQNVSLAAHALGLGTCHSGGTFEKVLNLIDFFQCPGGVIPVATLVLGYPESIESSPERTRLNPSVLIHNEQYTPVTDLALDAAYRAKEASDSAVYKKAFPNLPDGVQSLADIYARMKYPKTDMDLFGENYMTALRKQGFTAA